MSGAQAWAEVEVTTGGDVVDADVALRDEGGSWCIHDIQGKTLNGAPLSSDGAEEGSGAAEAPTTGTS